MDYIAPSELKTILHSKRANLYYLEYCRVKVNDGRVEYITSQGKESLYWNIPIANTTCILLGTGTSITQAAIRDLAKAGVLVGFSGGGGAPLFMADELPVDIHWLQPQSEYRPTNYLQAWVSFWFDPESRLQAAKIFQTHRLQFIQKIWLSPRMAREQQLTIDTQQLQALLQRSQQAIEGAANQQNLLAEEARLTKQLYKLVCQALDYPAFTRAKQGTGTDFANRFLDHGNYLAYGLGATTAWVLGLPHGLSVLHGKTRRGGLVFDIADLIKDALVLPQAFLAACAGDSEMEFRQRVLGQFQDNSALDFQFDVVKRVADTLAKSI